MSYKVVQRSDCLIEALQAVPLSCPQQLARQLVIGYLGQDDARTRGQDIPQPGSACMRFWCLSGICDDAERPIYFRDICRRDQPQ